MMVISSVMMVITPAISLVVVLVFSKAMTIRSVLVMCGGIAVRWRSCGWAVQCHAHEHLAAELATRWDRVGGLVKRGPQLAAHINIAVLALHLWVASRRR